jgi:hypothetical protein
MFVSLLVLGLLLTAAGFVTVGFGVPINAFSLGNTLIIAGTVAIAGGLILIGLAAAVRQLNRIAAALKALGRTGRPADIEAGLATANARTPSVAMPPPPVRAPDAPRPAEFDMPRPAEPMMPDPQMSEPLAAEPRATAPQPGGGSGPLDWLRPKSRSTSGEPPVVEISDEAPLSPRSTPRPSYSPLTNMAEPMQEPKPWPPSRSEGPTEFKMGSRSEQIARVPPPGERSRDGAARESSLFDVRWPNSNASRTAGDAPELHPDERDESVSETHTPAVPASERPVAILKSGVIEGMAYTLYADGSIEADLPQGTLRFASVDELRAHLEQHS